MLNEASVPLSFMFKKPDTHIFFYLWTWYIPNQILIKLRLRSRGPPNKSGDWIQRERRNLFEYSGVVIGLIIIGLFVTLLGFVKVKPWVAEGITFFVFLLFFEFLLVLLDPYLDKFTKGEPAYKLLINAGVAACIFPLHALFERMLKRRLMKRN